MDKENPVESSVVINYILDRIKKGLGINALIIGAPGMGKSYVCLRIMERIYLELYNEKVDVNRNVAYNLSEAFKFVKEVNRPGEVLVIEEVSVIASSRRAMALENVSLNYLLDTVRKKQVILLMNAPHIKAVDKHIQRMSHLLIECLRINTTTKFTTVKAFKLTNSQDTGKVYKNRFKDQHNRRVHRSYFHMPSKYICDDYEEIKSAFMDELYQAMEEKNLKKSGKDKGLNLVPEAGGITPKEITAVALKKKGLSNVKIGKLLNVTEGAIRKALLRYKKKTDHKDNKKNTRKTAKS